MSDDKKVAIVTGANRGIGLEVCRQLAEKGYKVVLTSRDREQGKAAAEELKGRGLDVIYHQLDVTEQESIDRLAEFVNKELGRVDALINNAGVFLDGKGYGTPASVLDADLDTLRNTMEANVYGPLKVSQALIPMMKDQNYGRIVNVSSGMGQLKHMGGSYTGYRVSKTALNALTRIMADELAGTNILVNSCTPGWVRTRMGGPNAALDVKQGADTPVWLADLPDHGPTGGFFKEREEMEW